MLLTILNWRMRSLNNRFLSNLISQELVTKLKEEVKDDVDYKQIYEDIKESYALKLNEIAQLKKER